MNKLELNTECAKCLNSNEYGCINLPELRVHGLCKSGAMSQRRLNGSEVCVDESEDLK